MAHTYRVCMVYDHAYSMLFVYIQRNFIPSNKMLTKINTNYTKVAIVGVEYFFKFWSSEEFPTIQRGLHVSTSLNS